MENFAADLDSSILYTTVEQVRFVVYNCKKVLLFFTTVIYHVSYYTIVNRNPFGRSGLVNSVYNC